MAAETEKELKQLARRFVELAEMTYQRNQYLYTGFLTLAEQDLLHRTASEFSHVPCLLFGGGEGCERVMARFGSEELLGYEEPFPILCLHIRPRAEKFAEELSHRDFLGACMNLGIERAMLGDIVMAGKGAYLYCSESIGPYIMEQLTRVRHTAMRCELADGKAAAGEVTLAEREYQAASERLDGIVAKVFGLSRAESIALFREKKIFVNGRLQENNSAVPQKKDVITVRGHGKFVYGGAEGVTRKGKLRVKVFLYGA